VSTAQRSTVRNVADRRAVRHLMPNTKMTPPPPPTTTTPHPLLLLLLLLLLHSRLELGRKPVGNVSARARTHRQTDTRRT